MEEILTPIQVAELLKVHVKTVYKLAKEGAIAGSRIGRSWRFSKSQLTHRLSESKTPGQKNGGPAGSDNRALAE